ncbi:hypothetical protein CONCODRAFT_12990 [Conidiobolus coronatus NRRL 28638]|uniref:SCP domain-containing protein n=1 Tax=Conidiobolus coronatus (strain ATCC 28846 / CBS 209.66 / NRRL 28638) TaxID=796925 RepID=A0A137NRT9_CONC2|nr:hypothetical protein CONCODRAFT_12990 [Conidiobolus coronatus NRRL 28638]|eukprot:KXN65412.1 hypothetical protein CONCODRAFT_12990 [Conidiobolus coronatus NRRL 28638]
MKVHSIVSFFALYLLSGLNAKKIDGSSGLGTSQATASNIHQSDHQAQGMGTADRAKANKTPPPGSQSSQLQQAQQLQQLQQQMDALGKALNNFGKQKQSSSDIIRSYGRRRYQTQSGTQLSKPTTSDAVGKSLNDLGQQLQQFQGQNSGIGKSLNDFGQQLKQTFSDNIRSYGRRRYQMQSGTQLPKSTTISQRPSSGAKQQAQIPYSKNSQTDQRPGIQGIRGQNHGTKYMVQAQAPYPSYPQSRQRYSGQEIGARKLGSNSKKQGQQVISRNTQGNERVGGQATIIQKPNNNKLAQSPLPNNSQGNTSDKPTRGQIPSTSTKQQSNFDSLDNNQGNQETSSQTSANQKPGTTPKIQAQPTAPSNTQGNQGPSDQPQGGLNKPAGNSAATGKCRKIRAAPKMDIKKVLMSINKVRGELPPLKINSALIKASILKATENSKAENAALSHSKECGFNGKSAIQYTTTASTEDELFKKLTAVEANVSKIKEAKFKAFGAAKVDTKWTLTFGEE